MMLWEVSFVSPLQSIIIKTFFTHQMFHWPTLSRLWRVPHIRTSKDEWTGTQRGGSEGTVMTDARSNTGSNKALATLRHELGQWRALDDISGWGLGEWNVPILKHSQAPSSRKPKACAIVPPTEKRKKGL